METSNLHFLASQTRNMLRFDSGRAVCVAVVKIRKAGVLCAVFFLADLNHVGSFMNVDAIVVSSVLSESVK
jgi:hypothetical protein